MRDAPNFDRLAGPYRWLEYMSFGPLLWRCRVRWLPRLAGCRRALVLGDGDGRFTAALLRRNPEIRVHAVDLSPRMLEALERRAGMAGNRATTEVADLRLWSPAVGAEYDLIVTHFFLDCLTSQEVANLALRLGARAAPDALWVVSDFAVPPTRYGRMLAKPVVTGLYFAFGWLTGLGRRELPDHAAGLAAAGWKLRSEDRQLGGLLFSQLWQRPTLPGERSSELE
jgi:SAM-dependent methyltransferase